MRETTNKILDLINDGVLTENTVLRELLHWVSESEVKEFYDGCYIFDDFNLEEGEEEEEE